jgi:dissimilatory sulfite reductase (desulfoviridin) alpha/beta subunit
VGLAVQLENRYRGVRSPHKFKGGVSGCIRECAEAQGKDFGVIATDKGWNSASDIPRRLEVIEFISDPFSLCRRKWWCNTGRSCT